MLRSELEPLKFAPNVCFTDSNLANDPARIEKNKHYNGAGKCLARLERPFRNILEHWRARFLNIYINNLSLPALSRSINPYDIELL